MKVVFAGGGTGGHVYPGLSVARALNAELRSRGDLLDMLYVGVKGRVDEAIVPAAGVPFRSIDAGQLRVGSPLTFARNLLRLARGTMQSISILRAFRPNVVFATGGYASVPVGVAARLMRRPLVVFLPDVTPGWAVRLLSRLATRMVTTSDRALEHLPRAKSTVTGYPVRDEFWNTDAAAAREKLGLAPDAKVLLIAAGSLGAQSINDAVFASLPSLFDAAVVVHVTGASDAPRAVAVRAALTEEQQARYLVHAYLNEMPEAMLAADLVISRAGASTLGELPAAGAPAIVVPGEYEGWSQAPNAEHLESQGAAVILRNSELSKLAETAIALLNDDPRRSAMRDASRRLARPDASKDLARVLMEEAA